MPRTKAGGPLLDAIKSFKPLNTEFLKDNKVLEEASKAIGYSSKLASLLVNNVMQSAKNFGYTYDAVKGATKIDDTQKAADPAIGKTDAGSRAKNKSSSLYCTTCKLPYEKNKKTGKFEVSTSGKPSKDTGNVYDHTDSKRPK